MNRITLIGNLTHDPKMRSTQSGVTACAFTSAASRRFAGADMAGFADVPADDIPF